MTQDLAREQRVAVGLGVDQVRERDAPRLQLVAGGRRERARRRLRPRARQRVARARRGAAAGRRARRPVDACAARRCRGRCATTSSRAGSAVPAMWRSRSSVGFAGPLEVVEHEEERSRRRRGREPRRHRVEQAVLLGLGIGRQRWAAGRARGRRDAARGAPAHRVTAEAAGELRVVGVVDEERQRLDERLVRDRRSRRRSGRAAPACRRGTHGAATSLARRVLPMPGSPASSTSARRPSTARCHCSTRPSSSTRRPTNGIPGARLKAPRERDAPDGRGAGVRAAPTRPGSVTTGSGQALQLECPDRRERVRRPRPATRRTISAHRISPPSACAQSRAASTTGVP